MYLAAREWEIQPSEFWEMTMVEWMLEAQSRFDKTPEGRALRRRDEWLEEAELSDEEWWSRHGTPKNTG